MPNRLAGETSRYLLQHAENPVDWYPWGEEALSRARSEDKPIFLSIGYSSCHWCHVMARESFEDPETARMMNSGFINIKVDREERPDLDRIYMNAVQAMTGRGGWPMSVFLAPGGEPFYGGTYFPPSRRYGMPAFREVLASVRDAWDNRRDELLGGGKKMTEAIGHQAMALIDEGASLPGAETLQQAFRALDAAFDADMGGWGDGPKFPQPMIIEFLLRSHLRGAGPRALEMAEAALKAMARGGIYDQIGGGFHRYSVDAAWLTPHFEKMLYDNALLARVYIHAWQLTGDLLYRRIAEETLDYAAREMLSPVGGFFSSQDADSGGVEGKYYVWTAAEIEEVLGDQAARFSKAHGVTAEGNFEGSSILALAAGFEEREALSGARKSLMESRMRRVPPGRDDKAITSWNGMMIAAFAEAARVFGRDDYRETAARAARFLLENMRDGQGRLSHVFSGGKARLNAYLDDYACLAGGLLELYRTDFDPAWYEAALALADVMISRFGAFGGDKDEGQTGRSRDYAAGDVPRSGVTGFYDTSDDHEELLIRPREVQDNAVPSGSAAASLVLQKLAALSGDQSYADIAIRSIASVSKMLGSYPLGFGMWLQSLDFALSERREIAVIGDPGSEDASAMIDACSGYRPNDIVAAGEGDRVPLLAGRSKKGGKAAAYVCSGSVCGEPVTSADELRTLIR